jgi:hypothetical protein
MALGDGRMALGDWLRGWKADRVTQDCVQWRGLLLKMSNFRVISPDNTSNNNNNHNTKKNKIKSQCPSFQHARDAVS